MTDLKIEIPQDVSPERRAELIRDLKASAQVQFSESQKKDAATTLFIIAATIQTVDILWKWYQDMNAGDKKYDVEITTAEGNEIHLKNVTLDELREIAS